MMICCSDPRVTEAMSEQGDKIVARLAAFIRSLRAQSYTIGTSEAEDAVKLLASDIGQEPARARQALKALCSGRHEEWSKFDELFDAFWFGRGMKSVTRSNVALAGADHTNLRELGSGQKTMQQADGIGDQASVPANDESDEESSGLGRMEGASRIENVSTTDFRKIRDPEAIAAAHHIAERLAKRMLTKRSRRQKAASRGRRIDFRRTIRHNIEHGGVPLNILRLKRKARPLRLVILLDVSGSMSQYTSMFVRFIHGVLTHFCEAEAFLVHTSLVHVSPALADRDPARALARLSLIAKGVGGGTRIGESLAQFNTWHAKRVINARTCVMIISDGYDTGPPERLGEEMRRLSRRCRRIVWLNPMIAWDGYAPSARGLQAAMPYIDLFAPAHSIKSLAALEPYLSRI